MHQCGFLGESTDYVHFKYNICIYVNWVFRANIALNCMINSGRNTIINLDGRIWGIERGCYVRNRNMKQLEDTIIYPPGNCYLLEG